MYGQTIDTLTVLVRVQGVADTAIWSLTSAQGQQWKLGNAPISMSSKSYQIVFQGRRGTSVTGDIAIDDISFTESSCGVRPNEAHPIHGPTTLPTPSTTPGAQGAFNCSFDNAFCGWTQDHTDNFDWTRMHGRTPSAQTGPTSDHTSSRGYYVYTEASNPRRNGDKARLISPDVAVTGTQTKCLTFWYFMMGRNVAQLNVYAKSGLALPTTPIWRRSGNQGNRWVKAKVDITAKSVFNVVFESVRGGAYGDIAVDDVAISDGSCTSSAMMVCNFESATICGFQQSHTDQFDWTRGSGSTNSVGTGPSNDHTYGTSRGHYMFTEASGRQRGNKARLISPIYQGPSTPMCLKFWYHMYGSTGQTMNIYKQTRGVLGTPIWTKSGSHGNQWLVASVNIPVSGQSSSPYQIVFEGVRGTNYRSDIAIDDFSITSGACLSEGACNFDNGFCTWTNAKTGDQFDWTLGTAFPDHTSTKGQYAYLESSNPNHPGYDAKLVSESLSAHTHKCMYFWYNVYGSNIGTLRVWTTATTTNPKPLWELSGSQQNQWYQGIVPLQNQNTSFTVIFEAVRGTSNVGHIAIDDVTFDDAQSCQLMLLLTGGSNFSCDFTYDTCGWTQDQSDQLDWTRQRGHTASRGTGPNSDHTNGRGYYIYTEASGKAQGSKARLVSPVTQMASGQQNCVTFWYTMYGAHVGGLNIYVTTNIQSLGQPVWRRTGNQGNSWRSSQFTLTGTGSLKVVLEASRGNGYQGDIAVDDISLAAGPCSGMCSHKISQD
ncbi:MAM and LDL-receptor class A domain-containing protein 1-like [Pecten maximus]|uniref:MAM and LDL-receptor class A domain-containing protein 1-like n=1 Tax=Pecten maximus TaxID=6579 RepID=UPI00145865D5|nr:MAM and LDL-receptor class A domain-containing protein 1-like [Pecten maximus]